MRFDRDTIVDYPAGALRSHGTVLAVVPVPSGVGVVLDRTAFHAVDAKWPDQGPDHGTLEIAGTAYPVEDAVVGATDGGDLLLGDAIPVRTGTAGWTFHVVHVLPQEALVAVGDEADITVDAAHRRALSAGHTACHLASLALDAALANAWTKEVPPDALGAPGFDALACESSRILENGSLDIYRIGKSLRKRGFDPAALDALDAIEEAANGRLAEWVASGAAIRIDRDGDGLGARRRWVCALPGGDAVIPCGGTHLDSLAELSSIAVALHREERDGAVAFTMSTTAVPRG